MKKFNKIFALSLFAVLGGFMSACSNDKDDEPTPPELNTPKYEGDAALYQITSQDCDYSSIELTASGNYIVMPRYYSPYFIQAVKASFLQMPQTDTRASYMGIISGTYTKTGDNTYKLNGFGTITVTGDNSNALDLEIVLTNGEEINVTAAEKNQLPDSTMTDNLCRTWNVNNMQVTIKVNGRTMFEATVDRNNYSQYDDEFDDEFGFPDQVIFTKAGTYMVTYTKSGLGVSTWSWQNQSQGIIRYSWDYDDMYDDYASGTAHVAFPGGNRMAITETFIEDDDDELYEEIVVTNLSEASN